MTLQLPIEEYFRYHPPTTPERIALHDRVNRESLEICKLFIQSDDCRDEWLAFRDAAILLAEEVCHDRDCLYWAKAAIAKAMDSYLIAQSDSRATAILMHVQQFRIAIKAVLPDGEIIDRNKAFIEAYGSAIERRANEGFTSREILIADWIGDNLPAYVEEIGGGET